MSLRPFCLQFINRIVGTRWLESSVYEPADSDKVVVDAAATGAVPISLWLVRVFGILVHPVMQEKAVLALEAKTTRAVNII
jgi:hypothetical protein